MKVLLVNGSPHKEGCTYTALAEVGAALNQSGIGTDVFWIGNKPLSGCIACKSCMHVLSCQSFSPTISLYCAAVITPLRTATFTCARLHRPRS